MQPDDLERLRRAARRYERHRGARPGGYPELGLAALLHIAAVAAERDARPQTLHYGILALDQLSVRMRAAATADDPKRRGRQAGRARRRVFEPAPAPGMLAFRTGARSPWPAWVALDRDGAPILVNGELQFVEDAGVMRPERSDTWYRDTLRDAYLLAGLWSPLGIDGRAEMAADQQVVVDDAGERTLRARPGPYELPGDRRDRLATDAVPGDVRELAQRAGMSLAAAADIDVDERAQLLERYRERGPPRRVEQPRVVEPVHHPACPCDACSSTPPPAAPPAAAAMRGPEPSFERDWEAICGELRRAVADTTYEIWLAPLAARAVVDGTLVIAAPGEIRSWVADRFASVLQACAAKVLGAGVAIEVVAMDARCCHRDSRDRGGRADRLRDPNRGGIVARMDRRAFHMYPSRRDRAVDGPMTSPGQVRLRELLVDAAAGVDPTVNWDKQRLPLLEIRAAVMSDPAITTDAITGQNLRLPAASPTYAAVQQAEIQGEAHPEWTIDADAVLYSTAYYYDPMLQEPPPACAGGDDPLVRGSPLACAGGAKALSTFGALTWLALGRALPTEHCPRPTLLTGSRIVLCDGAGVHRSLACFLWGAAPIGGRVTVIDDTPDDELHAACRLVESRLPEPGLGLLLNERDRAGCRGSCSSSPGASTSCRGRSPTRISMRPRAS